MWFRRRVISGSVFGLLLAGAQWEELGPPAHSARLEISIEPRMPVRLYAFKNDQPFRLTPADALLPIRVDVFYRDSLWLKRPDPGVLELIAAGQFHYFLLKGSATFTLPPGKYRIEAYRGLFYTPAEVEFELKPDATHKLALPMKAWDGVDPAAWISSDDHIHLTRARSHDPVFLSWLEAEDLTVGNFLQLQRQMDAAVQYGFGPAAEARRGGYSIRSGQESRNEFWGHINLLGPSQLVRPLSTGLMYANSPESFPFPAMLFAEGRKRGATVGYAHFFQSPQHSTLYMDAALGNIDFVEVFQFGVLKTERWYELLNAGFRVTGIAGSDFPVPLNNRNPWPRWLPLLGPERTLVRARPGPDSYDTWARGVREGRVVVSNGPIVEIDVNPATGRATATAAFWRPLEVLEIVRNGAVIASNPGDGRQTRLRIEADVSSAETSWVAARVRAVKKPHEPEVQAHTNPVYPKGASQPVRVEDARRRVLAKWDEELAYFRSAGILFPDAAAGSRFWDEAARARAILAAR